MKLVSIVAGGAGFVGANLVPELLARDRIVVVSDNYCRGTVDNLAKVQGHPNLHLVEADLSVREQVNALFQQAQALGAIDEVWHLAANSDIPAGVLDSDVDFKDTFQTSFELLRAMRDFKVDTLHFASSSAVYGDMGDQLLHEAIGPLLPISNYGAMKLASEAQASAAAESFLSRVNLFRFPNVVGIPATHGVILDFVNKLATDPTILHVLGNGTQQKAYLHVSDLVRAMLLIADRPTANKVELVNIGPTDEGATVRYIAECVVARISPLARIAYGEGNRGWVGDVPKFNYSTERIQSYGWSPVLDSKQAIARAVDEVAIQQGF
ncbi:NAD-dependent epimerase/dehydratase family protein [Aquitalea denitrificans]|uniref:NAD-dependent epimerase/dehydratase family protein n=1 Tax=Aquitalea denitrificans TaxID=519081 RepID=UPI00135B5F18|nr:NAD-dependent epimerase/dehydratase family protein [Aquitalea denitrificans]